MDAGGDDDSGTKQPELPENSQNQLPHGDPSTDLDAATAASLQDIDNKEASEMSNAMDASLRAAPLPDLIQLDELVDDIEYAECPHCDFLFSQEALDSHKNKCILNQERLVSTKASCPHCYEWILREKLESHKSKCRYNLMESRSASLTVEEKKDFKSDLCPHCKQLFLKEELELHKNNCYNLMDSRSASLTVEEKKDFKSDFCPYCKQLFLKEELELHKNNCSHEDSPSAYLDGTHMPDRDSCPHCYSQFPREKFESHKIECAKSHRRPLSLAEEKRAKREKVEAELKAKRDKIEADLKVLRERKAKASSVVVLGPVQSGKSTLTNCLTTHLCTFIDFSAGFSKICTADSVIFVVDSFNFNMGQQLSNFRLAFYLDIKPLVWCFNKMDRVFNPHEVYRTLKLQVSRIMNAFGYSADHTPCVPISALNGVNITEKSNHFEWYEGPTLLEAVNQTLDHSRHFSIPRDALRVVVYGVLENGHVNGRVHSGTLADGQSVVSSPGNWSTEVEEIIIDNRPVRQAFPGEMVNIKLKSSLEGMVVTTGSILSCLENPARETQGLTARVMVFGNTPLETEVRGHILGCHMARTRAHVTEILCRVRLVNLDIVETYPWLLERGQFGIVQLTTSEPITVEKVTDNPSLSRIMVHTGRHPGHIVAIGVVTDIVERAFGSSDSERHHLVLSDPPSPIEPEGGSGEGPSLGDSPDPKSESDEVKTGAKMKTNKNKKKKKKKKTKKKRGRH